MAGEVPSLGGEYVLS